jgi:hypothetical protein
MGEGEILGNGFPLLNQKPQNHLGDSRSRSSLEERITSQVKLQSLKLQRDSSEEIK